MMASSKSDGRTGLVIDEDMFKSSNVGLPPVSQRGVHQDDVTIQVVLGL